jgi:hypothetical protein
MTLKSIAVIPLLALLMAGAAEAQGTLFKCVDEKGVTHYGETMPPQCAKRDVNEINKQGRVLRKLDAPLTPEQQRARDEANAKKAEDDKKVFDQRQKDLALLGTYGAEKEINAVRDKDVAQIEQRRKFLEGRITEIDAKLVKINSEMEFYIAGKSKTAKARDGKEVTREIPPQLQADFDRARSDRSALQIDLTRLESDKKDIIARYEGEKDRFRRLKAGMRPGTILDDKGNVLIDAPLQRTPARR